MSSKHYAMQRVVEKSRKIQSVLFWKLVPGVTIKVKWPVGEITAGPGPEDPLWYDLGGAAYIKFESADPNDHYRPALEKEVGRQGWDWAWALVDNDWAENKLTIKLRKKHSDVAMLLALRWS